MRFFVLRELLTKDWTYSAWVRAMKPKNQGSAPECPVCGACVGLLPWLPPYHAEIVLHGQKLGDLVDTTGDSCLVSERFRKAWESEGLRGIEKFSPVERIRLRPARFGKKTPTLFHVAAQHFGTQVDVERSLIEYDRPITCQKCKSGDAKTIRGFSIDESSWTGEDFFFAWGVSPLIVTDRVREMRDKYGLTNMNMTPVEEYLWDPLHQWTPFCQYPFGSYDLADPTSTKDK